MTPILPSVNAVLNATAAVLLVWGYTLIRRKRIQQHRRVMQTAFVVSCLFLVCYLVYHYQVGIGAVSEDRRHQDALPEHSRNPHAISGRRPGAGDYHAPPRLIRALRQAPPHRPLDAPHLALRERHRRGSVPDAVPPVKVLFIGGTGIISMACTRLALERGIDLTLLNRGRRSALRQPAQKR